MNQQNRSWLLYSLLVFIIIALLVVIYRTSSTNIQKEETVQNENPFTVNQSLSTEATPDLKNSAPPMSAAIENLEKKLKEHPEDAKGWELLGRSYQFINQDEKAREAFKKAIELGKDEKTIVDALAELNTQESKDSSNNNHSEDISLKALTPYLSDLQGTSSGVSEPRKSFSLNEQQNQVALTGTVILDKAFSERVNDNDTVFVFARAAKGPRMPLAIIRKQVSDLPIKYKLDDSMAMTPEMKLSSFTKVVITARISKSGSAMPEAGDIEGKSRILDVHKSGETDIVMNSVIDQGNK